MSLIKSKRRFADHGEVFTPARMVEAMLELVKHETQAELAAGLAQAIVAPPPRAAA